ALEQKNPVRTARSTVSTATEVYDYLRLLYAKIGRVHCPACGAAATSHSPETIVSSLLSEHPGARAHITFRLAVPGALPPAELWTSLNRRGFARVRVNGTIHDLASPPPVALVVPDRSKSLAEGAVEPWTHPSGRWYQRELLKAARRHKLDTDAPWEQLPDTARALVYAGDGSFPGITGFFEEVESYRYKLHVRVFLS